MSLVDVDYQTALDEQAIDAHATADHYALPPDWLPLPLGPSAYLDLTARADVELEGEPTEAMLAAPSTLAADLQRGAVAAKAKGCHLSYKPTKPTAFEHYAAAMFNEFGPLVLLTMQRPEAEHLSMVTGEGKKALQKGSKAAWYAWTGIHAKGVRTHKHLCVCTQRGDTGNTHDHALIPLAHLSERHRATVAASPDNAHLTGFVHAELVSADEENARNVARYSTRKQKLPGNVDERAALLERLQDELLEVGEGKTRLYWTWPKRWRT